MSEIGTVRIVKCANVRCINECPEWQKYCRRECAPYGHLVTAGAGFTTGRGRRVVQDLPTGEITCTKLANALGITDGWISVLRSRGVISGRSAHGVIWYRPDEVREALTVHGYTFDEDGRVRRFENGRFGLTGFKAKETARYQGAR